MQYLRKAAQFKFILEETHASRARRNIRFQMSNLRKGEFILIKINTVYFQYVVAAHVDPLPSHYLPPGRAITFHQGEL